MNKVLIITYYWPPSGGGGVQRWLKFVKYLPEFGWEPVVYTPEKQTAPAYDESLLKDVPEGITVVRRPIIEPYGIYNKITGKKKGEAQGAAFASSKKSNPVVEDMANRIRSNLFIPDARALWVRPSVRYLKKYLKTQGIHTVITTGPPHSMHLIGLKLKQDLDIKWVADFRDPWTDIDYYGQLKLTKAADKKHRELERIVLFYADLVISVSEFNRKKLFEKANCKITVITNGYDESDIPDTSVRLDEKFTISHIGTFMANRNPEALWDVLKELIRENEDFRNDFELRLTGKTDKTVLDAIDAKGLMIFVKMSEPVSHEKAVNIQRSSQVLLLTVNQTGDAKGMVTGKVFEYMASKRPVLAIGPEDGDLAKILKETHTGVISDFEDRTKLKKHILDYYDRYKSGKLEVNPVNLEKYSRKNLTRQLVEYLEKLNS